MQLLNKRQKQIIDKIDEAGYLSVQDLSSFLNVSLVTIRKDLTLLEEQGYLFRTHGGASKQARYAFEQNVSEKENIFVEEKKRIAFRALDFVNNSDFIILASGTTIHYLARIISNFDNLTVLTPSLKVALELCKEKTSILYIWAVRYVKVQPQQSAPSPKTYLKTFRATNSF